MTTELEQAHPGDIASPVLLELARKALLEAETLPEVAAIVDRAEAIRAVARKAHLGLDARNDWAVFTLQAQREGGRLLAEIVEHGGDRRSGSRSHDATLNDFGIDKTRSSRWQQLARMPDDKFEAWAAEVREAEEEITAAKALRRAKAYQPPQPRKPAKEEATTTTTAEPSPPTRPGSTTFKRAPDTYIVDQIIPRLLVQAEELAKVDTAALPPDQQYELRRALDTAIKQLRKIRDTLPGPALRMSAIHTRLLDTIRAAGEKGRTDKELETETGLAANTLRPRRGELVTAGHVIDSGERRDGTTVWQATGQP